MYSQDGDGFGDKNKPRDLNMDVQGLVIEKRGGEEPSFRLRRSLFSSILVLLFLSLCIAVIALSIQLYKRKANVSIGHVCVSPGCVTVSSRLMSTANLSSNPCKDFFQYSCGGWKESNFLPASQSQWNGFTNLRQKTANIVKRALESSLNVTDKNAATYKLVTFYRSCVDEKLLETAQEKPLVNLLSSNSSWPVLNSSWTEREWNQTNALVSNHNLFFSYYHHGRPAPIFNAFVKANDKASNKHIIEVRLVRISYSPSFLHTSMHLLISLPHNMTCKHTFLKITCIPEMEFSHKSIYSLIMPDGATNELS